MAKNQLFKRFNAIMLAGALLGLGAAAAQTKTGPEGSWLYTVTIPAGGSGAPLVFQGLETYDAGGGYSEADQLSFTPGYLATAGHGSWKPNGTHGFLLTYDSLTYANGKLTGLAVVRQTTRIGDDGASYSGSGDYAYSNLDGTPVAGGSGKFTITAKRIPAQTPQ